MEKEVYVDRVTGDGAEIVPLPPAKLWMVRAMDRRIGRMGAGPAEPEPLAALRARRELLLYGPAMRPDEALIIKGGDGRYLPGQAAEMTLGMEAELSLRQVRRGEFGEEQARLRTEHYADMAREVAIWLARNGYVPAYADWNPVPPGRLASYRDWSVGVMRERGAIRKALRTPILGREEASRPEPVGEIFFLTGQREYRGLYRGFGKANSEEMDALCARLGGEYCVPFARGGPGLHAFFGPQREARPGPEEVRKGQIIARDVEMANANTPAKMMKFLMGERERLEGEIDAELAGFRAYCAEKGLPTDDVDRIQEGWDRYKARRERRR